MSEYEQAMADGVNWFAHKLFRMSERRMMRMPHFWAKFAITLIGQGVVIGAVTYFSWAMSYYFG